MRGTLFLALAAALLCCGCGASAQYVANPQMRMQMMPQMQMAEQSPFTAMAAGESDLSSDFDTTQRRRYGRIDRTPRVDPFRRGIDRTPFVDPVRGRIDRTPFVDPFRRGIDRTPFVDPRIRRFSVSASSAINDLSEMDVADSQLPVDDPQLSAADAADAAELMNRVAFEAEGWLQTTENSRIARLRDLFSHGGRATKAVQEGTAGPRELSELKAVRLGLTQEFQSYPSQLQREVRPAHNRIINALSRVIVQLQNKIERGTSQEEEGGLEMSLLVSDDLNVSGDLHQMMGQLVASELGMRLDADADAFQTQGRWGRGWGWGGWGGFGWGGFWPWWGLGWGGSWLPWRL